MRRLLSTATKAPIRAHRVSPRAPACQICFMVRNHFAGEFECACASSSPYRGCGLRVAAVTSAHSSDLELLTQFGKNARLELSHMLINISAHRSPTARQLPSGAALAIHRARSLRQINIAIFGRPILTRQTRGSDEHHVVPFVACELKRDLFCTVSCAQRAAPWGCAAP